MATASDPFESLGLMPEDRASFDRSNLVPEINAIPTTPAEEVEMDRMMYGILKDPEDTPQKRMWLGNYRDYRKKRGEEPFKYLPQAEAKEAARTHREQLPFFDTMFSGPANFTKAFPQDRHAEVDGWFETSLDPEGDKRATANKLFYEAMTGEAPNPDLWAVQRTLYARQALDFDAPQRIAEGIAGAVGLPAIGKPSLISEKEFYERVSTKWKKEKEDSELSEKVASMAQSAAINNKSISEAREEVKKLAGERWKEFEPAMRKGFATVLKSYSDKEITVIRSGFEELAKSSGAKVEDMAAGGGNDFFTVYGQSDAEGRRNLLSGIGMMAEAEGIGVVDYFARIVHGYGSGMRGFADAEHSRRVQEETAAVKFLLDRGIMPAESGEYSVMGGKNTNFAIAGQMLQAREYEQGEKFKETTRPMTDGERKLATEIVDHLNGRAAFFTDARSAGIEVKRDLDQKREGFWDTIADGTVMMANSLPAMGLAMVPFGAGLPVVVNGYYQRNLSDYRMENRTNDTSAYEGTAFVAAVGEAGIDRLQISLLGAKAKTLQATLFKWGKPGVLLNAGGRVLGVTALESVTEVGQDLTEPALREITAALKKDVKGPDWDKIIEREKAALGDIVLVSAGFSLIFGVGGSVMDYMDAKGVGELLKNPSDMEVVGIASETAKEISKLSHTNPAAAAKTLQAAAANTPVEVRKANSEAARARMEAEAATTEAADAGLPTMEKQEDGKVQVNFPGRPSQVFDGNVEALEAVREWEQDEEVTATQAVRSYVDFLTEYHSSSAETAFKGETQKPLGSLADVAAGSVESAAQAQQRILIAARQAGVDLGDVDLSEVPILGTSRNRVARGVATIATEFAKKADPLTVIEEHAEGIAKWLLDASRVPQERMLGWLREAEVKSGESVIAPDFDTMTGPAQRQEIVEAWSYFAKNNAVGKIEESMLPDAVRSFFRAFKEAIHAALRLAARFVSIRGELDPEFVYWLDVSAGVNEEFEKENLVRKAEAEMEAAAFEGMPEIRDSLKGMLPHPDTARKVGGPLAGELQRVYDSIRAEGGSKGAGTRKANEYFLPAGEMGDLDDIRVRMNAKGFSFDTPADMLDSLDLSVSYGKPQYGFQSQLDEDFSDISFSVAAPAFFSQLERTIEAKIPKSATPAQVLATVDPSRGSGVKAEEIKWTGLKQTVERLAAENGGKVPKQALLDHLRNEGRVRFNETTLADNPEALKSLELAANETDEAENRQRFAAMDALEAGGAGRVEQMNLVDTLGRFSKPDSSDYKRALAYAKDIAPDFDWNFYTQATKDASSAKAAYDQARQMAPQYGDYKLGGGDNYREVVLTMPEQGKITYTADNVVPLNPGDHEMVTSPGLFWYFEAPGQVFQILKRTHPTREEALAYILEEKQPGAPADQNFTSRHFEQVPNYVAHMRLDDRTDATGAEGTFIEEIQSDRHQQGRSKGYRGEAPSDEDVRRFFDLKPDADPADYREEMMSHSDHRRDAVADAPFRKDWPLQMFKRALRDAVEAGKDWIGWTVGETQADRFNLSQAFTELRVFRHADGKWDVSGLKAEGGLVDLASEISQENLPEYMGKELAQKVVAEQTSKGWRTYAGLDLKLGGEGMKGFYDKILPAEVGKYVKPWGGKVAQGSLGATDAGGGMEIGPEGVVPAGTTPSTPIWKVEITDAMRESVKAGQPSFSVGLPGKNPLAEAIRQRIRNPEDKAKIYERMLGMVQAARKRFDDKRLRGEFGKGGLDRARFEEVRDLATLEAIAKALPAEIRGRYVGAFTRLDELKTAKGREDYMIRLLGKVEAGLEKHMQKLYRQAIRKVMDKSRGKKTDSRNLRGKIGGVAHAVAKQANDAMTLDHDTAIKQAAALRDKIHSGEIREGVPFTLEQFEEYEGKAMALELFADYDNADSARLAKGLELLRLNYSAGRDEWIGTLKERKEKREADIETLRNVLKAPEFITTQMLEDAAARDKRVGDVFGDSLLEWVSSAYQTLDRLKERTSDPAAILWVDQQQERLREARGAYDDAVEAERKALDEGMRGIFGVQAGWKGEFDLDPILYDLSKQQANPNVSVLEGVKKEDVSVPILYVEALVNGETSGYTSEKGKRVELDDADLQALTEAWEEFQDLPDEAQKGRRMVSFERVVSSGKRGGVGMISQLEGLKEWLAMRQPDASEKYKAIGWDERTFTELDAWLKPEVKLLGLWMVDRLEQQAPALDKLHRSEFGIGLDLVANYFPLLFNAGADKEANVSMDGADVAVRAKTASALKGRVSHRARPRRMNALSVFLSNRAQIHYFMTHAEVLRELVGVFRSRAAGEAISYTLGPNYLRTLSKQISVVETNGTMQAEGVLEAERFVRKVQSGYALGVLGLKLKTLMVNTTAVWNAFLGVPAGKILKGFSPEYVNDLRAVFDSPAMQRRLKHGTSHEMRIAMQGGIGGHPLAAGSRRVAQAPMEAIRWVDSFSNAAAMAAVYRSTFEEARAAGMPEEMAKTSAENEISRLLATVAQPDNLLSRSMGEVKLSQNPLGGLLFLFASETRKNFSIGLYAARKLATGKGSMSKSMAAQQLVVLGLFYSAMGYGLRSLYEALFKAEDDEPDEILARWGTKLTDAKAWTHAIGTEHLKGVPLIGEAANHAFAGMVNAADVIPGEEIKVFDSSPNPLNRLAKGVGEAGDVLKKGASAEERIQSTIDAIQGTMALTPETAVLAQVGNVGEDLLGLISGKGWAVTEGERRKRIKARFGKFSKQLDEELGKTTGEDGKVRKDVQSAKWQRKADWLREKLAPLEGEDRAKALEEISPTEGIRELLE